MMLVGNSNISCFNQQGLELVSSAESVEVHWVGALQIDHFFNGHPAGARVRKLFAKEKGWKFLSIGTHDIFGFCQRASNGQLEACHSENAGTLSPRICRAAGKRKIWLALFPPAPPSGQFSGLWREGYIRCFSSASTK